MLYGNLKKSAFENHELAIKKYDEVYENRKTAIDILYRRRKVSERLIIQIEDFINSIANSPKEMQKNIQKFRLEKDKFHQTEEYAKEAYKTVVKSGVSIFTGVTEAVAVANVAPTVMMSVATTFGKASTGRAISTLTGAAAQKAALAWLGRGALSAGGAGVAGGEALLALAGPVGWIIAGTSVLISGGSVAYKNKKVAMEAEQETKLIEQKREQMLYSTKKIEEISNCTIKLYGHLTELFRAVERYYGSNFELLSDDVQKSLGILVNNTFAISELMNKIIQDDGDE